MLHPFASRRKLMYVSSALQNTTLPLQYPVKSVDGKPVTAIPVEKGTQILVSIIAANHNKDIWGDDASEWKPQRWLKERSPLKDHADLAKYPGVYNGMCVLGLLRHRSLDVIR